MWDEADKKNKISAMMRVTGFPVAITASLLAKGVFKEKGIVAPEDAFTGDIYKKFMTELEKRDIRILEIVRET
jgi:saccharopine dehydrogenase-like NADP-dependent oxidoreductase